MRIKLNPYALLIGSISCNPPIIHMANFAAVRSLLAAYERRRITLQDGSGHEKGRFSVEKRPETSRNPLKWSLPYLSRNSD